MRTHGQKARWRDLATQCQPAIKGCRPHPAAAQMDFDNTTFGDMREEHKATRTVGLHLYELPRTGKCRKQEADWWRRALPRAGAPEGRHTSGAPTATPLCTAPVALLWCGVNRLKI